MTEIEAKGFIQGKLDCMKKCGIFNKEDIINNDECDNFHYCYSQGNFGEQKEAFQMAIKALEKQMPKKVITPPCNTCEKELCDCECKHFAVTYRDDYRCPTCDSNGVYMSEYEFRFDYCPNCGQKLDWSDEE